MSVDEVERILDAEVPVDADLRLLYLVLCAILKQIEVQTDWMQSIHQTLRDIKDNRA